MGIVYHGSKTKGLKKIIINENATHGDYAYGTKDYEVAIHFSKKCGDDMVYSMGKYDGEVYSIVERIPGAFEKMYPHEETSIYYLDDSTFKSLGNGFSEVVSEVDVDVIKEDTI